MPITRRTFIKAGAIGGGALLVAGAWGAWRLRSCKDGGNGLSPSGRALFAAVIPAFLDGVVPAGSWTTATMDTLLDDVNRTVSQLSPSAREELQQFFCLLDRGAVRLLLAGTALPWRRIDAARAARILARWRHGRTAMLVSAYQALHDITFAAWYATPAHWEATGYPGPPRLTPSAA
ncbi:MAG: twin-arginine translocation signal domain-containing protein [Gemmatimonadaceae bacterium]|nr:twin-arginine translocation signal domain-containing protein [Gemmatimonadaceae bacterium]